jgi:nucleoside-triphosphatase THEP1
MNNIKVTVSGNMNVGKTTVMIAIERALRDLGIVVQVHNQEVITDQFIANQEIRVNRVKETAQVTIVEQGINKSMYTADTELQQAFHNAKRHLDKLSGKKGDM